MMMRARAISRHQSLSFSFDLRCNPRATLKNITIARESISPHRAVRRKIFSHYGNCSRPVCARATDWLRRMMPLDEVRLISRTSSAAAADGAASCKISAPGATLSTTQHHLQSKAANTEFMELAPARLNCIGKPQNGQCGCGASESIIEP